MELELTFPEQKQNDFLDSIMSCFSEKELFEYYYGKEIKWGKTILSPLRDENSPSFVFYISDKGKPMFFDHGTGVCGDLFVYLQLSKCLSYRGVISMIINDFNRYSNIYPMVPNVKHQLAYKIEKIGSTETTMVIEKQNFSPKDIKYWHSYGISLPTLKDYRVFVCKTVSLKKDDIFTVVRFYSKKSPVYAFSFGNKRYKIYCPLADKQNKWIGNHKKDDIEGFDQLEWFGNLLIITKSMKDVMLLRELGYNAISLHSETNSLSEELYVKLKKRFEKIICFYDNDTTGRCGALKLFDIHGIPGIEIKENKYNIKDISDYCHKFGFAKTKMFFENLINERVLMNKTDVRNDTN